MMKALGVALLAIYVGLLLSPETMGARAVSAHALFDISPSPEPSKPVPPADTPVPPADTPVPPADTPVPTPNTPPSPSNTTVSLADTPSPNASSTTRRDKADLTIEKQASASQATIGDVIDFTITVRNKGNGPAGNVAMVDDLPPFLELVNVTVSRGLLSIDGKKITVTFGEVAAGEVITVVVSARVVALAEPPNNTNIAMLTTSSTSDSPDDNKASVAVQVLSPTPVSPAASSVPLTPTIPVLQPSPTVPRPVKLPPTGEGSPPVSLWLLGIGVGALALGWRLRRARQ